MPYYTDLAPGDTLQIGDTLVTLEKKSGRKVRLKVVGVADVRRLPPPPVPPQEQDDGRGP